MRDGRERKVRSSSFFYHNMASTESERENEQIPCSSEAAAGPGLAAIMMQRGNGHYYIDSSFLYSRTRRGYITRRPCPRVPSGHAGRYSSSVSESLRLSSSGRASSWTLETVTRVDHGSLAQWQAVCSSAGGLLVPRQYPSGTRTRTITA